jgi:hypothetical protein
VIITRDRLIYAALVVSESAWVYAFIAVLGVAGGSSGSPLSFFVIAGILGLSIVTYSFLRWKQFQAFELFYFGATAAGLILAYMAVAATFSPGSFEIGWIARLTGAEYLEKGQAFRGTVGGLLAAGMWFRGIRLATSAYPEKNLKFSFRLGLFFIGLAAIIDMQIDEPLNVFAMILVFFGAGLGGLNVGHLVSQTSASSQAKTWNKAIGGVVVGVISVGLLFGLLPQTFWSFVTSPVRFVFDNMVKGILIIVGVPIVLGLELVNRAIGGFFGRDIDASEFASQVSGLGEEEEVPEMVTTTFLGVQGADRPVTSDLLLFLDLLVRYALVALVLFLVALFLFIMMRKAAKRLRKDEDEERESLLGEMNFASDIGDLFSDLLPNLKDLFGRGARKVFRLPDGPPGVVEALKLYYQMLTTAEQNDVQRSQHLTPKEFRSDLRQVFASELVDPATEAFNRAQYGDIPSTDDEIAKMRSSFRVIKTDASGAQTQAAASGDTARFETVTSEAPSNPWANREKYEGEGRNWFGGGLGLVLACGGSLVFMAIVVVGFAVVISFFG